MSSAQRVFRRYTDEDLDDAPADGRDPTSDTDYLAITWESWGNMLCGWEGHGVRGFDHCLDALKTLDAMRRDSPASEVVPDAAGSAAADDGAAAAIARIRATHSDEGIDLRVADYKGTDGVLEVLAAGYWDDFVPEALRWFAEYHAPADDQGKDDEPSPADEVRELSGRSDIHSPEFVRRFLALCTSLVERYA